MTAPPYLNSIEDLVDKLDTRIFLLHLLNLQLPCPVGQDAIERDHDDHEREPGEDGRPQGDIQKHERKDDLQSNIQLLKD